MLSWKVEISVFIKEVTADFEQSGGKIMKYLKVPDPCRDMGGDILVMEDINVEITGIYNPGGFTEIPKNSTTTIKRGEILICWGGSRSSLYFQRVGVEKRVVIPRDEFKRIKTLRKGDCVRIKTLTGDQIGIASELSHKSDWIGINKLEGTLEFQKHPAGDSIGVKIDDIRAISNTFENIRSNIEV
ncbi:hypothetical protein KAT63_01555 [Candidatus Parcubacteria bacterium]|nr:hypothetical protein [Candidatus Parcubacteria bacterium]